MDRIVIWSADRGAKQVKATTRDACETRGKRSSPAAAARRWARRQAGEFRAGSAPAANHGADAADDTRGNRLDGVAEDGGRARPGVGQRERRGRRGRRWLLVALLLAAWGLLATVVASAILLAALPGVGDAQHRVDAVLQRHGGRAVGVPPPAKVAAAVVAVEDRRFYAHHGVDPQSLLRVAWAGLHGGQGDQGDQGGSTITQQLAKRIYTGERGGVLVKLAQIGLAIKLERQYTKEQILAMYLDAAYFGDGRWGVVRASEGYFGKPPQRMSWGETSMLAGLVQAPSADDPRIHLATAERRQRHVLDRLVANGTLDRAQADAAGRRMAAEAKALAFRTV
jgi:membrane peptidoglycan carboxypeptidase